MGRQQKGTFIWKIVWCKSASAVQCSCLRRENLVPSILIDEMLTWWQNARTWWQKAPHLVGKAPQLVGKAPHLVGKAPHLVGKAPHLVGKAHHLMFKVSCFTQNSRLMPKASCLTQNSLVMSKMSASMCFTCSELQSVQKVLN